MQNGRNQKDDGNNGADFESGDAEDEFSDGESNDAKNPIPA